MKFGWYLLPVLGLVVMTSCFTDGGSQGSADNEFVVNKGTIRREVVADGVVFSPATRSLAVPRVEHSWELSVATAIPEGSLVAEGEVILEFDESGLLRELEAIESEVMTSQLRLDEKILFIKNERENGAFQVRLAEIDLEKARLQVTDGVTVSRRKHEEQLLALQGSEMTLKRRREDMAANELRNKTSLELAKQDLESAKKRLQTLQTDGEKLKLRASVSGYVLYPAFRTNAGWVSARPGISVHRGTNLVEISPTDDLVVKAFVPEVDGDGVMVGIPARVGFDRLPGFEVVGQVTAVSAIPTADEKGRGPNRWVKQYEVTVALAHLPPEILPGMTARVTLVPVEKAEVIRVPIALLHLQEPANEEVLRAEDVKPAGVSTHRRVARVWVTQGASVGWREVELGVVSFSHAEISAGLSDGEVIGTPEGKNLMVAQDGQNGERRHSF